MTIQLTKTRKWLLTGVAAIGAVVLSLSSIGSVGAVAPADPPGRGSGFAPANLASGGHENSYTSVVPCRLVDTRISTAGNLHSGVSRDFLVSGTTGFTNQGGQSGGCSIPSNATAVTASISGTGSNGNGYLRAWAPGSTEPLAIAVLLTKGVSEFTGTTIPVNSSGMRVKATNSDTRFVVDVTGYYIPKMYMVSLSTASALSYSRFVAISHPGVGLYTLTADTNISTCAISVNSWSNYNAAGYASGSNIYVVTGDAAGNPKDVYFQVAVTC